MLLFFIVRLKTAINSSYLAKNCQKYSKWTNLQILENFAPKGCFFHAFNNIKVKTPISFKAIVIKTQRKKKERKVRYYYNSVACIKTLQSPYQKKVILEFDSTWPGCIKASCKNNNKNLIRCRGRRRINF